MRVKFTAPFDYVTLRSRSGTPRASVAYQPGELTVPRAHGEAAVAGGYAVEVDAPNRDEARADIVKRVLARGGAVKPNTTYIIGEKRWP